MSGAHAIRHIFILWCGTLLGAALAFVTQALMARSLGRSEFGNFSAIFATVSLTSAVGSFGLQGFWLSVYGKEGDLAKRWLPASFRFAALSGLVAIVLAIGWGFVSNLPAIAMISLLIMLPYIAGQTMLELVTAKFQLKAAYASLAVWQFLPHLGRLVGIILLLSYRPAVDLMEVAAVYGGIGTLFLAVGAYQLKEMLHSKPGERTVGVVAERKPALKDVFMQCWTFGVAAVFYFCYLQSSTIVLYGLAGANAAASFSVAFAVLTAIYLLPGVVYQKFLMPKLHRWAYHDPLRFYRIYRSGTVAMAVAGTAAMLLMWAAADTLILTVFGAHYSNAGWILKMLGICIPIRFVATSTGAALLTSANMRRKALYMGLAAGSNVLVSILTVPEYGEAGAIGGVITGEIVLLGLYVYAVRTQVFNEQLKNGSRP